MKVAFITDTHWGDRNDNPHVMNHMCKFNDEIFFPILRDRGIKRIIHLGDLVDRRKYVNFQTSSCMRQNFLEPLAREFEVDIIAGNHDTYFKNTNRVNAFNELLGGYPFRLWIAPGTTEIGGTQFLMLPWISNSQEDYERAMDAIKKTPAKIVCGHLALNGFEQNMGSFCQDGMERDLFNYFEMVFTGHFHKKSTAGNIYYLGSPYETRWSDFGIIKGFHIFDTATRELEFIESPLKLFKKLEYDDTNLKIEDINDTDFSEYKSCFVKLIVKNKSNPYLFDLFVSNLEAAQPANFQIMEDSYNISIELNDEFGDTEDTMSILKGYCDQLTIEDKNRSKLELLLRNLYNDATYR